MRITADTNLLVRVVTADDSEQCQLALDLLQQAELVVLSATVLCELCWVLKGVYQLTDTELAKTIRDLVSVRNTAVDNLAAVEGGLDVLNLGGDFADGVVAVIGQQVGSQQFVTFDAQAARLVSAAGIPTRLLTS